MTKELTKKQEIKEDIKHYSSLEVLENSEGGKLVIRSIEKDIISAIDETAKYKTATHAELIAICAKLTERIALWRVIIRAKKQKRFALDELKRLEVLEKEDL